MNAQQFSNNLNSHICTLKQQKNELGLSYSQKLSQIQAKIEATLKKFKVFSYEIYRSTDYSNTQLQNLISIIKQDDYDEALVAQENFTMYSKQFEKISMEIQSFLEGLKLSEFAQNFLELQQNLHFSNEQINDNSSKQEILNKQLQEVTRKLREIDNQLLKTTDPYALSQSKEPQKLLKDIQSLQQEIEQKLISINTHKQSLSDLKEAIDNGGNCQVPSQQDDILKGYTILNKNTFSQKELPLNFIFCIQTSNQLRENQILKRQIEYKYKITTQMLFKKGVRGSVSYLYFDQSKDLQNPKFKFQEHFDQKLEYLDFIQSVEKEKKKDIIQTWLENVQTFINKLRDNEDSNIVLVFFLHSSPLSHNTKEFKKKVSAFQKKFPDVIKIGVDFNDQPNNQINEFLMKINGDKNKNGIIKINEQCAFRYYYHCQTQNAIESITQKLIENRNQKFQNYCIQTKTQTYFTQGGFFNFLTLKQPNQSKFENNKLQNINKISTQEDYNNHLKVLEGKIDQEVGQLKKLENEKGNLESILNHMSEIKRQNDEKKKLEEEKRQLIDNRNEINMKLNELAEVLKENFRDLQNCEKLQSELDPVIGFYSDPKSLEISEFQKVLEISKLLFQTLNEIVLCIEKSTLDRDLLIHYVALLEKDSQLFRNVLSPLNDVYHS